ncbi:MAG: nucleotide exchange factor GrpE [Patescibacteria group bacterium]
MEEEILIEDIEAEGENSFGKNCDQALLKTKEKLRECEEKSREYLDGWQRAKADYVNLKRENESDRIKISRFAAEALLLDTLGTLDLFDLAMSQKTSWEKVDTGWRTGIEAIYSNLKSTLSKYGLVEIKATEGDKFDPNLHLAVESKPAENPELDETIQKVISNGYQLGEKVIRPTKIIIWQKS